MTQNKIEQLLQQHCLDGVEYLELGKVCKISTGQKPLEIFGIGAYVFPYINAGLEASGSSVSSNTSAETITIPSR